MVVAFIGVELDVSARAEYLLVEQPEKASGTSAPFVPW